MEQQLAPLDGLFLAMETPALPAHIGGLSILDPSSCPDGADRFDFERFRDFVAERLPRCPRFGWRVQEVPFGLDAPYWVDDGPLDLDAHLHRVAVPAPGGEHELAELAGVLFAPALDRSRPLWEMFFIEGLQGGRVAVLWKVHHALMDGQAGSGLIDQLVDLSPDAPPRTIAPIADRAKAGAARSLLDMLGRGVWHAVQRPTAVARHAVGFGAEWLASLREHGPSGPEMAPHVPFNGVVSGRRSVAWSSVPLDTVLRAKKSLGVTVNDVVLALTGGAVRDYLLERGALPDAPLRASVPVSLRKEGDTSMGNQISDLAVDWGTDVADPLERVRAIHADMQERKRAAKAGGTNPLGVVADALAPGAISWLMHAAASVSDRLPLPCNAVVSNVRMTDVPLYLAGARVETVVPMSMLAPTQGLNVTVVSYAGELRFGFLADPALVPDLGELAGAVPKELLELLAVLDDRARA